LRIEWTERWGKRVVRKHIFEKVVAVTTDENEGQKQAEQSNKPRQFAVDDRVRLKAGGPPMRVLAIEDYGNQIVCEVRTPLDEAAGSESITRETHSAASLEKYAGKWDERHSQLPDDLVRARANPADVEPKQHPAMREEQTQDKAGRGENAPETTPSPKDD
jgi:hypothetical protein